MTPPKSATAHAHNAADPAVAAVERPTPAGANAPGFGSDIIADALSSLDIPYIALTPGASYRGLHDSIVNYLGNSKPQMLLCLHEEAAVAIAHGYAKVTGKAMVSAVHSNVGLMHADHGDVQRLVRPHADGGAWRDRPGRRRQAPAVDRLDSHRARPGRAGPRIHQMGRSAGFARRGARGHSARHLDRQYRPAGSGLYQFRRRSAGSKSQPSRCRRSMLPATCRRFRPRRLPSR